MANRQALRDLQARLAERLQAARSNATQGASWLAVQMGGANYLLPLEQAGEIFSWPGVLRIPYAKKWFWGVCNLRGNLMGVVDACAYLGHPVERSEQSLNEVSLLSINAALQVNTAIVVDRLMGLRGANDLSLASDEAEITDTDVFGASYADSSGVVWKVLNLQHLVQQPQFLNVRI